MITVCLLDNTRGPCSVYDMTSTYTDAATTITGGQLIAGIVLLAVGLAGPVARYFLDR